ncbi:hypothetical protein [Hydrogenovibrio halophilus]|uniref:hypothetical protein n=1 Tax=Hydrogenovibrio halophilus TaxID=373391 RepID=UPI000366588E|nr:hypothetical protein [Hydrogenovibrio halophilus]
MSRIDTAKETIAYLKFWLGVMVVSDISLVGWLLTHTSSASDLKILSAVLAVLVITLAAFMIYKKIERSIKKLTRL